MKRMIKMAMMAAAMFMVVTTVAKAQDAGAQQQGARPGRGNQMAMLLKDITLTDAQKAKVDSITKAFADKNAPLMEAMRGGDADARTKMMENRKAQNEAIKGVLTPEQQKQFDANVAAMPQGRGRPPVGR
jgi:Spy/CpxP family protein refolding chaperone